MAKFSFLHLSDLHISKKNIVDINIVLTALWEDLKKLTVSPDFIIFTGDLIKNGASGYEGDCEYDLAEQHFIKPLLEVTKLDRSRIFFVPGNHEVNRNKINTYADGGLTSKLVNRDELNLFIDNISDQTIFLQRLDNYDRFINSLCGDDNKFLVCKNNLSSTYKFPIADQTIGIACLNSSWRAYGGEEDYGKLLIGERQLDNAIKDLQKCDFRIAVFHHPLEWLAEYDRESIFDRLVQSFDVVCSGHLHTTNLNEIVFNKYKTVFSKGGAIYQNRIFNGYSMIHFDLENKELEVFLRQYFDRRRTFDKALSVAEDGYLKHVLVKDATLEIYNKNSQLIKTIRDNVCRDINKRLVSNSSADTIAPKDIDSIYVPHLMTEEPEGAKKAEGQTTSDLINILRDNKNILFVGKKEIGKTTLLNYICKYFIQESAKKSELIIPCIIDFEDLLKGNNIFEKAMASFLCNYGILNLDLKDNLEQGNYVLLIDNFNFSDSVKLDKLKEFFNKFPNNRIVLAMNESILQDIKIEDIPELGFTYKTLYINTFRRGQVRQLVRNWFTTKEIDEDAILDKVMNSLKKMGVPRTPLIISLLLWIFEKQANFLPVNESVLLENFIEILLEKLNIENTKYQVFDYTNKIDLLAHLAAIMAKNNCFYFMESELTKEIQKYFDERGLEFKTGKYAQDFFEKGILISINGRVYFRYNCFLEFFIAKYMSMPENKEFRDFILEEDKFLSFSNEIVYYTGLNRKSLDILILLESRVLSAFERFEDIIDINEITKINLNENFTKELTADTLKSKVKENQLSAEEKDNILEDGESSHKEQPQLERREQKAFMERSIECLDLYAKVLKNSELIIKSEKQRALELCINKYCKMLGLIYIVYFAANQNKLVADDSPTEILNLSIEQTFILIIPIILQSIILQNLGSPKLKPIIDEQINLATTEIEKFLLVCLYGDMKLEGYLKKFKILLDETRSKYVIEITIAKMLYYNAFYIKTKAEEDQLADLLSELIITNRQKIKTGPIKDRTKAHYLTQFKKRSQKNQHDLKNVME